VAGSPDLFERRNRARIVAVVFVAACNYVLAVALAAAAVTLATVLLAVFNVEIVPDSLDTLEWFAYGLGAICALAFVVGVLIAVVRIPFARRTVERRVLSETGAVVVTDDSEREVRNLLDGLAIAAGIPPPRFAVVDDPAPNSFSVGTRPEHALVAVTRGLAELLSRDELEAVLAYEVVRIRSWDVALATWIVALTGEATSALDADGGSVSAVLGWIPRRIAETLQVWALRDQGVERDRAAVRFTRNPRALVRALEKLDADPTQVGRVSRSTAPLWIEFPARVLAGSSSRASRRLAESLLLDERLTALRQLAHMEPSTPQA
jgi:heat shock protein HtpX